MGGILRTLTLKGWAQQLSLGYRCGLASVLACLLAYLPALCPDSFCADKLSLPAGWSMLAAACRCSTLLTQSKRQQVLPAAGQHSHGVVQVAIAVTLAMLLVVIGPANNALANTTIWTVVRTAAVLQQCKACYTEANWAPALRLR